MAKNPPSANAYLTAALAFFGIAATFVTILRPEDRVTFWSAVVTFSVLGVLCTYGALRRHYGKSYASEGPVATVSVKCTDSDAAIEVTNDGAGALFWATLSVSGAVKMLPPKSLFCRWAHTTGPETWIAHGQTCRLILAERRLDHAPLAGPIGFSWWVIHALSEGRPVELESMYHSNRLARPDPAAAPDIDLAGQIVANPDLIGGLKPYRIVLKAFRALDAASRHMLVFRASP